MIHKHDCEECLFLFTDNFQDYYFHLNQDVKLSSVIIRNSSEPSDNSSYPLFIYKGLNLENKETVLQKIKEILNGRN